MKFRLGCMYTMRNVTEREGKSSFRFIDPEWKHENKVKVIGDTMAQIKGNNLLSLWKEKLLWL